ncbi:MAG: hypothetical protein ISQ80_03510 [Candidatus Actinomarina sp.]|jgi:hypothetical protein|nr:hypothetical protein [Actinomycetota bacterium]MBL6833418.1 hypothetical protein [Candidatus Actinomarina sp.]MBL6837100.1 hypothetical protein [Candidatus Actinomarina sp.]
MKKWNWPLLAVITWFVAFITGVWADYGTDEGIFTIGNLLTGMATLSFLIIYLNTRKTKN